VGELSQRRGLGQSPRTTLISISNVTAQDPIQRIRQGEEWWTVLNGAPYGDTNLSPGSQDPAHLSQCRTSVREELQALLTGHKIKGIVAKSEYVSRAL
jgi:hypothetical protein